MARKDRKDAGAEKRRRSLVGVKIKRGRGTPILELVPRWRLNEKER